MEQETEVGEPREHNKASADAEGAQWRFANDRENLQSGSIV